METISTVLSAVLAVFSAILEWFVTAINTAVGIFWAAETGLTFIGTLALLGLGIAVILMLFAMIRSYLKNRG